MKIILIGNAEFKKEEKFGSLIDEFEVVVRINRFRLETFEENLGTKTNIWALNRTLPFNRASVPFQFQKEFLVRKKISQDLDYGLMISYMPNGNEYSKVLNSVKQIDNLQLANTMVQSDYVRQKWKTLVKEPFYKPATGIMSILYFIEKFGEVVIHNFDNAETNHYFETTAHIASQPQSAKHIWSFDKKMIDELVKNKKVKYLRDL
tara:strand:- start:32 stop:649 length:618 start_codon:yes stop_codon:yes gene_type:complete